MNRVVVQTEHLPYFIKELGLTSCRVGHTQFPIWYLENTDTKHGAKLPKILSNIILIRGKCPVNQWLGLDQQCKGGCR